ncbi:hypothetical protein B0H17DRAFT_1138296 [Mycena rosella]|uniref:Uncharacterized protein n=1 Tax=Mycena rosella TaxID=1033263 RepID=A0AAD7D7D2_MYCRO|nr:hypothetical protein B0H17DRAFT_1138296 [Mycena rosella]
MIASSGSSTCVRREKQYYILVLLETLFQHLPANIRRASSNRSCVKYGFLDRYLDRILFGVGLPRLWLSLAMPDDLPPIEVLRVWLHERRRLRTVLASISKLISYLRVSGIEHADRTSLGRLAGWLLRRTAHCEGKLRDALADLAASGVAATVLRAQWADQIAVQTKPVARRSKMQGQVAVEQVLEARQKAQQLFERVASLEEALADDPHEPRGGTNGVEAREGQAVRSRGSWASTIPRSSEAEAQRIFALQMNGRAVKQRLRAKLRDRKFELDPIERSFRRTRSENQRNEHAGAAIKQGSRNIAKLVKEYNKICDQIEALIKAKKVPARAVAPVPVPAKASTRFGFGRHEEGTPPLWLRDDKVRLGIQALLQKESLPRRGATLAEGARPPANWFATEWRAVDEALQASIALRPMEEILGPMPFDDAHLPQWGPTDAQILACQIAGVTASWGEYDSDGCAEDDDNDNDLFQVLQANATVVGTWSFRCRALPMPVTLIDAASAISAYLVLLPTTMYIF